VLLTLVTATIRRYSELHGDRVKGRLFRVMVPVNLRGNDTGPSQLGNCISLVPVTIPLDIRNPKKLLTAVHRRTEFLKRAHAAEFVSLASGFIGDVHISPDLNRLEKFLKLSFSELRDAVGLSPSPEKPQRKRSAPKQRKKEETPSTTQTLRVPIELPAQQPAVKSTDAPRPISEEKPVLMQQTA